MKVSSADRVVFPADGITKGEVVEYYQTMESSMMPFVVDRALTVERFPKGTGEKGFMQKNAPSHFGEDLVSRHEVEKEEGGTTVYPVVETPGALPAFANLGVITFHVPPSTVLDPWHPDWVIWDLDPPSGRADLAHDAAMAMREVVGGFEIETVLMTSGSNGYHLRARIVPRAGAQDVAQLARGIAALGEASQPDLLTLAFRKKDRGDRVFVDWLRNAPYSTSVVPWSLRAREGAPVAAPIAWSELDDVSPSGVTMQDAHARSAEDAWKGHEAIELGERPGLVESALQAAGIDLEPFDRFRSR